MKTKILSFLLLLFSSSLFSQQTLSKKAEVSLITGGAGQDLYAMYGHSALRIKDSEKNIDYLFNYGTFDFSTPNFVMKFVRGRLNYFLSVNNGFDRFLYVYQREGRPIYEQTLDFNQSEKQAIFDRLMQVYNSDERYYKYDFFFDNCSTRIRDILKEVLGKKLQFNGTKAKENQSFRELLNPYLAKKPWLNFGIHTMLGLPADRTATQYEYMYLPFHLKDAVEKAKLVKNGKTYSLVKNEQTIYQGKTDNTNTTFLTPMLVFTLFSVLIAGITYLEYKKNTIWYFVDFLLLFIAGFLGFFFLLLWFGTDHKVLPMNLNMLWAFPLHLIISFFLLPQRKKKFLKNYFFFNTILLGITIFAWFIFLPQYLHYALFPVALVYLLRSGRIYLNFKKIFADKIA